MRNIIYRMALGARKFDVNENYNPKRTNRNKQHVRENLTERIFLIGLDVRKFSCAKISTFTVPYLMRWNECCTQSEAGRDDPLLWFIADSQ